ncbi:uncharacterized protein LOC106011256 [Aplysia californica]|uniref:Uncharacterized protein LOC106011256 n=1 Tax=Aplysia californica TaxID=6500 RepID=A0ABM0ZW23_APLCA|nr:uncharacterized protein LOC106011256 [Aplysia californica]
METAAILAVLFNVVLLCQGQSYRSSLDSRLLLSDRNPSLLARNQRLGGGSSYTNGLLGNIAAGPSRSSCFERCQSAYLNGGQTIVRGCACSQFDFTTSQRLGGALIDSVNCDCPLGTVCELDFGVRRCVPRTSVNGGRLGGSYSGSRLGNRLSSRQCGVLSPRCEVISLGSLRSVTYRFTYDYSLGTCVRVPVRSICFAQGRANNIFTSQRECRLSCQETLGALTY